MERASARTEKFGEWLILFQSGEYSINFVVTQWEEVSENGGPYKLNRDLDPELEGFVKWDGCSEWRTGDEGSYGLHCCGWEGLNKLHALLLRCYRITQENCPNFDSPLADLPDDAGTHDWDAPAEQKDECPACGKPVDLKGRLPWVVVNKQPYHESCWEQKDKTT